MVQKGIYLDENEYVSKFSWALLRQIIRDGVNKYWATQQICNKESAEFSDINSSLCSKSMEHLVTLDLPLVHTAQAELRKI